MMRRILLVAVGLVLLAASAWGQGKTPLGFKDIYLGMPKETFQPIWEEGCRELAVLPRRYVPPFTETRKKVEDENEKKERMASCLREHAPRLPSRYRSVGSIKLLEVRVFVSEDKVGLIGFWFWQRDYQELRVAFIEKYGPPIRRETTLNGESLTWILKDGEIALNEFRDSRSDREDDIGTAAISSKAYNDLLERERKSHIKKDAEGL